jgi:hypothetical protein
MIGGGTNLPHSGGNPFSSAPRPDFSAIPRMTVYAYGGVFLLNRRQKTLLFHRPLAGTGDNQQSLATDFVNQAIHECGQVLQLP